MSAPHNTIRTYALVAVFVSSAAMISFSWWLIQLLSSPTWCSRATGADNAVEGATRSQDSVDGCLTLLSQQVSALAINSHMTIGVQALGLLVLMVVVVAGGRLSFKANRTGVEGSISSANDEAAAAQIVADEAREAADDIARHPPSQRRRERAGRPDDPDGGM